MTRLRHDAFAKDILTELLTPFGEVRIDQDIPAEPRRADVLFLYNQVASERLEPFGIFPRMADSDAIFEAYRGPLVDADVIGCMAKLC